jgi:hypothetical protein
MFHVLKQRRTPIQSERSKHIAELRRGSGPTVQPNHFHPLSIENPMGDNSFVHWDKTRMFAQYNFPRRNFGVVKHNIICGPT